MTLRSALGFCMAACALAPSPATAIVPAAPAEVSVVASDGAATIGWKPSEGATSYNVYWSDSPAFTTTASDRKMGVKAGETIRGLTNGARYYFAVTALSSEGESKTSSPAVLATPEAPSNAALLEQCKHSGSRSDGGTPYGCVWMMGDGYAQILKTGDTSTSFGIGIQAVAFVRPAVPENGQRRMDKFEEASIFFKKGAISTIEGSDQAPFAAMVLDPQSASFSFDARYRHEERLGCTNSHWFSKWLCDRPNKRGILDGSNNSDILLGFAAYANGGSAKWAFTPSGAASSPTPIPFNVYAYGVGPSLRFLPDWMEKNFVTLTAAVYFTQRIVQGDPTMRHQVFGTTAGTNDHTFTGVEPQFSLQINTLTVTASLPILNGSADRVSHAQLFMSVGLRTGALLN